MLKNYVITIWRQIRKNKLFSFINIFGLALGMAACLVIAQYVNFHYSFDDFHSKSDKIYRIENNTYQNGESLGRGINTSDPMTEALKEESRHIASIGKFYEYNYANNSIIYSLADNKVTFEQEGVYIASKEIFDVFDFPFIVGNETKFGEPQKAIFTRSVSERFFDDPEKAIGTTFSLSGNNGAHEYELVGILEDLPKNSHIQFEVLLSYPSLDNYTKARTSWGYNSMITYLVLKDPSNTIAPLTDINRLHENNAEEVLLRNGYTVDYELVPLKDIHLSSETSAGFTQNVDGSTLLVLSAIAFIILIIAWINYMNLSLVKTIERLKEMGIRKCMGSSMRQLTALFILEALIMNLVAFCVAIFLTYISDNYLIEITGLPFTALIDTQVILLLVVLIIAGTLLIGFYPYALLKTINIVNVLVGKKGDVGGFKMRKSLVFVQFMITFTLIAGTLTVYNQINYMREADLGIDIENVLVLKSPPGDIRQDNREDVARFSTLKTELLKHSGIKEITNAGEIPGEEIGWGANLYLKNQSSEKSTYTGLISMDVHYPDFFGIDIIAGRALRRGDSPWTKGEVVINQKLAEQLGFSNPEDAIGEEIEGFYGPIIKVVGVAENYHHTSLHNDYQPLAYILSSWTEFYFVKLQLNPSSEEPLSDQLASLINVVDDQWNQVFSDYEMNYFFLDSAFDAQYNEDLRFGKIFTGFSSIAILIACLGLFGLVSFTIQQRTKEIGIRKVLGASAQNLTALLSKEYIYLILIACIVSIPLAWYIMYSWLQNYTFRINLGWWFYVIPVAFVIGMAFLSIIFKITGTIKGNPINSLRYE
ncbi:MAG: FtsX-like permease family protein [Bacteroidota bacterium]